MRGLNQRGEKRSNAPLNTTCNQIVLLNFYSNFPRESDKENWLVFVPMFPNTHMASQSNGKQIKHSKQTKHRQPKGRKGHPHFRMKLHLRPLSKNTKLQLMCQDAATGREQMTCCGLLSCRTILLQITANKCMGLPPNNQQTKRKVKPCHELQQTKKKKKVICSSAATS